MKSDPPPLILHLGAHRTGSTRLQIILDTNLDVLSQEGIIALTPPRPGKRNTSTIRDVLRALPHNRRDFLRPFLRTRKARALLLDLCADRLRSIPPRSVILSEENLLGPPFDKTGAGLYASAYPRLVVFRRLLGYSPQTIHLTLRSYDTFLVSAYAMRAVYGERMPPFDDIRETLLSVGRGWPDLVADVIRAFPQSPLKLTSVEHDSMETRGRHLVGQDLFARFRLDGGNRPNTAPTLEAMARAAGVKGSVARDNLVARYADGTRFDPLTEEERTRLSQRYSEDIAHLQMKTDMGS